MFKRKIDQAAYDALTDAQKALYSLQGDKYVLQVEDDEDDEDGDAAEQLARLQNKRRLEAEHRKNAERERDQLRKELKDLQDKLSKENDDESRKKGDVDALDKSWKAKYEAREAELTSEIDKHKNALHGVLVDSAAQEIAGRVSTAPDLLKPVIAARLMVDYDDNGVATTRVKDAAGNLSALTLKDLEKEIVGDLRYASVIIAGKGSGGGGRGNQGKGGDLSKKLSDMSEQERVEWARRDPAGFRAASSTSNNF